MKAGRGNVTGLDDKILVSVEAVCSYTAVYTEERTG